MSTDSDEIWQHPHHYLTDDMCWRTDHPVPTSATFPTNITGTWLTGGPGPFDIDHDQTARIIETNSAVSACTFGTFTYVDLAECVPMGYSNLYVLEKRAVVVAGRVQRIWPKMVDAERIHSYGANDLSAEFRVLGPDESSLYGHGRLGVGDGLWPAVGRAVMLSELMGGRAILVARVLHEEYWH